VNSYRPIIDLAGEVCFKPKFWQIKTRVNYLITEYLNQQKICDRLKDLPQQFTNPQPRDWAPIDLYHHGLHRIATEYSAVSLYIWLSKKSLKGLKHLATRACRQLQKKCLFRCF